MQRRFTGAKENSAECKEDSLEQNEFSGVQRRFTGAKENSAECKEDSLEQKRIQQCKEDSLEQKIIQRSAKKNHWSEKQIDGSKNKFTGAKAYDTHH